MTGTYDPRFGRNQRLKHLLELEGHQVTSLREEVWGPNLLKKATVGRGRTLVQLLVAYSRLLWNLVRSPRPDVYLVGYPGWFDVPIVALASWLRRVPLVFDPFVSLHDTLVLDRNLVSQSSFASRIASMADRTACRLASLVLADTPHHADFLSEQTRVPRDQFQILWVGARDDLFYPLQHIESEPNAVLFYGTMIPLQGPMVILEAARLLAPEGVQFVIVGNGQLRPQLEAAQAQLALPNVTLMGSVALDELPSMIAKSAVTLGIFGDSPKTRRVVPHKVFEAAAVGSAVITADTPAIRGAFDERDLVLVPSGSPRALADAVKALLSDPDRRAELGRRARATYESHFHERHLAPLLTRYLQQTISNA